VDRIASRHLAVVEEKIAELTRLAAELRHLCDCCRGDGLIANCRIIEALSPEPSADLGAPVPPAVKRALDDPRLN
jgi:hypothetical protein